MDETAFPHAQPLSKRLKGVETLSLRERVAQRAG
jgi:hypothetical protein